MLFSKRTHSGDDPSDGAVNDVVHGSSYLGALRLHRQLDRYVALQSDYEAARSTSVIAPSGQATTQSPQALQASARGGYAVFIPWTRSFIFSKKLSRAKSASPMRRTAVRGTA